MFAIVAGQQVKIGDYVGFKNGTERYGKIVKIKDGMLVIAAYDEDEDDIAHFTEAPNRCWVD